VEFDVLKEYDKAMEKVKEEGRKYRENIRNNCADLLHNFRDSGFDGNSLESAATVDSVERGQGAEGRGKEKGKTDGRDAVDIRP